MMRIVLYLISVMTLLKLGLAVRQFQDEYPGLTVCESTLDDQFEYMMPSSYEHLKAHFGGIRNCTHVEGNLVIQNIWPDPDDPDMSFLESIVEISGMVIMRNNLIKKVILPNLRIIRGEQYIHVHSSTGKEIPVSLNVELVNETVSGHAIFPSLKVISKYSVFFTSMKPLKYLPGSIQWEELFEDVDQQQLITGNKRENFTCHSSCNENLRAALPNRCWSASADHCQPRMKCLERRSADCKWCYFQNIYNKMEEHCCNGHCSGGCSGIKASQCSVCRNYINDNSCLMGCPPRFITKAGERITNPDFKLRVGKICANSCPANLLQQEDACLYRCSSPQFHQVDNQCLKCDDSETCGKIECHIDAYDQKDKPGEFYMTKEILEKFTNCQHVVGKFHFTMYSFNRSLGNITVPMLYTHLRNVQFITGDLLMDGTNITLRNLTFLENLKEIRHLKTASATAALNIMDTDLEFLGLRRLRRIYGNFEEHNNKDLCYVNTLPWSERIIKSNQFSPVYKTCNKTCDSKCGALGCWGPHSDMCFVCDGVRADPYCVDKCEDQPGFFTNKLPRNNSLNVYDDGSCSRCNPLCLQNCTGPYPENCVGDCRFFSEGNKCVRECSTGHFSSEKRCRKCNEKCYPLIDGPLCTGNGSDIGEEGCLYCFRFIRNDNGRLSCFNNKTCPHNFYPTFISSNEIRPNYPVPQIQLCSPCHKLCSDCTGDLSVRSDCKTCVGYWSDNICVSRCDSEKLVAVQNVSLGGECPYCDEQCLNGCFLPNSSTQCKGCKNKRLFFEDDVDKLVCVERCPGSHNYSYNSEDSKKLLCVSKSQWQKNNQNQRSIFIRKMFFIMLGPFSVFLLILLLSITRHLYRTHKIKSINYLKALYSNILEPDSRVLLNKKDLPNMNRLLLIPTSNLIFNIHDKPLGTGAFGAVYRGTWKFSTDSDKKDTLDVAIKVIQAGKEIKISDILEEAKVMASVSHKHCLRLIGVCLKYEMPCLVITFVELGSLDKYLRKHKNALSSFDLISWAEQIANGMAYLEMRNIIHRDLATRNVLLSSSNLVQITDFGLSHILQGTESNHEIVITSGQVPIRWLALETLISGIYSHKTDVWAFGITLWEMFTYGHRPYDDLEVREITPFLVQNNRLPQPEICSLELYLVMSRCWYESAQDRPLFDELMTILLNYSRNSTYYLNISNDPCLTSQRFHRQRLFSQYSYEMHQYPRSKGVYKQQSMDGTILTFDGDYQDGLLESSLRRQSSNFSWNSNKYRFSEDLEKKVHLKRHQSALSENPEENENILESGELDPLNVEYLEPVKK